MVKDHKAKDFEWRRLAYQNGKLKKSVKRKEGRTVQDQIDRVTNMTNSEHKTKGIKFS